MAVMEITYPASDINALAESSSTSWRAALPMTLRQLVAVADAAGWGEKFDVSAHLLTGLACIERSDGTRRWYRDGRLHREDGPAIERSGGTCLWYRDGRLHREDGPAIERSDGTREWYRDGELYREERP